MVTSKHQDAMTTRGAAPRVAFGSCQKRLMFPTHFAPDRMGNEMLALCGSKELGPGCYDNHTTDTPSPQKYQQDWTWSKVCPP
ncbi:hypothetical protein cypCar_00048730, partial [Cyprinus carpio]